MSRERKETSTARWDAVLERAAWITLVVALLFVVFVRVRLRELPLERDEGEYAYAGQLMLQGVPPYQLAYNMKLPGTYAAYAGIMAVFGQTAAGIHLGVAVVNLASIALVFFLGRRLLDSVTGAVAALIYALLSTSPALQGVSGHATHFVVVCALGGLLWLMRACEGSRASDFFLSGLLFGLALVMKQPGGAFGLFALVYVVWRNAAGGKLAWSSAAMQSGWMTAGLILPLVLTCLWLWHAGVFTAFVFWTVGYAHQYVSALPWSLLRESLAYSGRFTVLPTLAFWLLGAAGALAMWWEPRLKGKQFFVTGWVAASVLATGAGLYFRPHYFITFAPVLALLGGVAVSRGVQQLLRERSVELFTALATQIAFAIALIVALAVNGEAWFSQPPPELGRNLFGSTIFNESIGVSDFLRVNAGKDARIAVLGSEPQIYFLSGRRSATGHIYMYPLMGWHPFARTMQDEMIREIEAARPEWVVYVQERFSWLEMPDSDRHVFEWWEKYWAANYELIRSVNIFPATRETLVAPGRIADEARPQPSGMFLILQRKHSSGSSPRSS